VCVSEPKGRAGDRMVEPLPRRGRPWTLTGTKKGCDHGQCGASPQLRNMATNGGNLPQRTRCVYWTWGR